MHSVCIVCEMRERQFVDFCMSKLPKIYPLKGFLNMYFARKPYTYLEERKVPMPQQRVKQTTKTLCEKGWGLRKMSTEGYLSLNWCQLEFTVDYWSAWCSLTTRRVTERWEQEGTTDWRTGEGKGGNGERRNVKSGALEVILAGNLSYHSDMVKALQQVRGERERDGEKESRPWGIVSLSVFHSNILDVYLLYKYRFGTSAQLSILNIDIIHVYII